MSAQEFDVYQRLYGAPIRIVPEQEQRENEQAEAESLAAEKTEEESVLFRTGFDGRLEQVEYLREESVLIEAEEQQQEEDSRSQGPSPAHSSRPFHSSGPVHEQPASQEDVDVTETWPAEDHTRTHPLTTAGRFTTYPSTLHLPRKHFIDPITHLLSTTHPKHLREATEKALGGPGLPYSPSTPRISRAMEQRPVPLSAGQTSMREADADAFLAGVMGQVYASAMGVLVETRKRLGAEWLRGLMERDGGTGPTVLDVGGAGAGVVAWREVLRAEWESMREEYGVEGKGKEAERKDENGPPLGKATVLTGSEALRHRVSRFLENTTFLPRLPEFVDATEHASESEGKEGSQKQPRKQYDVIIASHLLWPIREEHMRKVTVQTLWSLLNPNGGVLVILEKGVPRGFEVVAGARKLLLREHISSPEDEHFEAHIDEISNVETGRYIEKEKGMIIAPCTNHSKCPLYRIGGVSKGRKDWCYFSQRYERPGYLQKVLGAKSRNFDDVEFSYLSVMRGRDYRRKEDDPKGVGFEQGEEQTMDALAGHGPPLGVHKRFYPDDEDLLELPGDAVSVVSAEQQSLDDKASPSTSDEMASAEDEQASKEPQKPQPHMLILPRAILPPIKRKGHILLDVCTPSATFERWVVNRRCGKQVYRDARKARWGDLWALGAKSRTPRRVKMGRGDVEAKTKRSARRVEGEGEEEEEVDWDDGIDELGNKRFDER